MDASVEQVDIWTIAGHEAAHAVMRWLVGLKPTCIHVSEAGGLTEGTGEPIRAIDDLLVCLAGAAWESGCGMAKVDFAGSKGDDLDHARQLLDRCVVLRMRFSQEDLACVVQRLSTGQHAAGSVATELQPHIDTVEEALERHFAAACEKLWPYADLIEELGERLVVERTISGRAVGAFFRGRER